MTSAARARPATTTSLDDLIAEQRVKPIVDLDALAALWPVDDDPDALDAFVADERKARRASGR